MSGLLGKHQGRTGPIGGLGGAGMVKIVEKSTGSVPNWTIGGVFTNTFTNYYINISGLVPSANNQDCKMMLMKNSDGSYHNVSEYRSVGGAAQAVSSASNNSESFRVWDTDYWRINPPGGGIDGSLVWSGLQFNFWMHNPMSTATYTTFSGVGFQVRDNATIHQGHMGGVQHTTEAHSGFRLQMSSGNIYSGRVAVYGLV